MDQAAVSAADLVAVIDGAGSALGWTRSYCNVVGTTIGAAFRAAGLDEDSDRIAVDPASAGAIAAEIVDTAEANGLSARTATTYASTWKRLAGLAHAWFLGGRTVEFWDDAQHLRCPRARKRRSRTDTSGGRRTINVDTAAGPAIVTLPEAISEEDRLRVVRAILGTGSEDQ